MSNANVNPYGYSRLLDEDGSSSSSDGSRGDLQPDGQVPRHDGPFRNPPRSIRRVTLHVIQGEQYRSFIRLLHKTVSQTKIDDESLPELSRDERMHRFVQIRGGDPADAAAAASVAPAGMIVRRFCLAKSEFIRLVTSPSNEFQTRAMQRLRRRGFHLSKSTISSMLVTKGASWLRTPRMTPVALPASILPHLESAISAFNASAPESSHIHAYTTEALRKIASTVSIQSAWRAHTVRLARDVTGRTIRRRAVVCIQRAWRSMLFLAHLRSLEAAQLLMHSMSAVTVVPNLCLTLLSARMLGLCLQRRSHCLPLHRLKWGYLQTTGEMVLLVTHENPRPGIPVWLGCSVLTVPAALARAQGEPVESDVSVSERAMLRKSVLESRPWTPVQDLLSEDGWVELQGPPRGAWDCVALLESGTRVREMQAQAHVSQGAAGAAAIAALPDDTVMRMVMFSSPEEAARRALLLFLVTWDPFYGQAAELVPVSLSSAMASSRPHATAAAGNATQDAWSVPEIAAVSNLVNPVTIQQENVRRHVAVAIALSLPGGSRLLPFLYDIAATITGTAPADSSADVASGQHSLVMKARSLVPFLHNYPAWLSSRRRTGANAKQDRVAGDEEVGTLEPGDIEASNDGLPVKEILDREASACFSIGCVGSGAEHKDALDQRGEVLYETVGGYSVRVPASAVEQELHRIVEQLDHGVGALRQAPVRRALAGEFGRMEQLQHEAFLRMRAADLLARKRVIVEAVRRLPAMVPRSSNTSNTVAPSMPLSIASVARSVQQLRKVWQKRNTLLVATVREAHALAVSSMQQELSAHVARAKAHRTASRTVAAAIIRDNLAAVQDAAVERVASVRMLETRRASLKAMREKSRAIGCAIAAEGRADIRAKRYQAAVQQHTRTAEQAAEQFERKLQREEAADGQRVVRLAQRQAAAQQVREAGFTMAHAEAHAAATSAASARTFAARVEERAMRERVGPAGGVWGGLPREVLRQPCPVTSIVAAAQNYAMEEQQPDAGAAGASFTDVEPWALPRVYADYLPCLAGVHPLHGAKVAFGEYVGVPSIPFGHMVGRQGAVNRPNMEGTLPQSADG